MKRLKLFTFLLISFLVPTFSGPLNINSAQPEEMAKILKGVGKKKAEAIVQYREEHGPFTQKEQLLNVPGIGKKTFNDIADMINLGENNAQTKNEKSDNEPKSKNKRSKNSNQSTEEKNKTPLE